jgi:hypothetical protein
MKNYKRVFILLLTVCYTSIMCYSQNSDKADIIITKTAQKIEAKILEIGLNEVKYKKFNYQDGPTYTVTKCEIASINYKNGEVEVFPCDEILQTSDNQQISQVNTINLTGTYWEDRSITLQFISESQAVIKSQSIGMFGAILSCNNHSIKRLLKRRNADSHLD